MGVDEPQVVPIGDAALLVRFEQRIEPQINDRVHALAKAVRRRREATAGAIGEPVPAYASLLVPFDPLSTTAGAVREELADALAEVERAGTAEAGDRRPPIEIAVRYGGDDGTDLDQVAERTGLTPAQVVELHASVVYRAYMLGFAPGFAYLAELPAGLELPRRDTPRRRVPAGSVAIAGRQTAVYPRATPGGWHLIGRTDERVWDIERQLPALITAGRLVRFVPA